MMAHVFRPGSQWALCGVRHAGNAPITDRALACPDCFSEYWLTPKHPLRPKARRLRVVETLERAP